MNKDRRLGRGLAALLGTPLEEEVANSPLHAERANPNDFLTANASVAATTATVNSGLFDLNVYEIDDNPFQPRRDFSESEIASLAESLREHDMLQPVLVRRIGDRFQLISGERRLRAAIKAGWSTVPARVREADDRLVAELAIVENLQRKDLNPIEKAMSFKRYLDEHQCTQEDLAQRLKIDRSTIANLMRLLELPGRVLEALRNGDITAGHARALLPLGDEAEQNDFCQRIQAEGMSVRNTEQAVSDHIQKSEPETIQFPTAAARRKRTKTDQIASLEQELRIALGTKVEIKQAARGRGRLIIHFSNADEFERLRASFAHRSDAGREVV
ncbi:MAG TPA: ParB/RepB/Spo0J family partition protein [Pirellulaceae bacterium]|nr:ParB/RepB/Spo0J family partition protein [Pirellulaceae bacterium]